MNLRKSIFKAVPVLVFASAFPLAVLAQADSTNASETLEVQTSQPKTETSSLKAAAQNLSFGGALEILVPIPVQNGAPDNDRGRIRSFELSAQTRFGGDLERLSGKVTLGGFDDSGSFDFGLREAFVQTTGPRNGVDVRVGKYFLPIGLFNQTRHSAWVTPGAPRVITRFFGEDGIVDTGLEVLWHPGDRFRLRAGLMNGYTFDAGITSIGIKPRTPTHYARPSFQFGLGETNDLTVALNYVGRMSDTGEELRIMGVDFSTKQEHAWFTQGEIFARELTPADLPATKDSGGTLYFEKALRQKWAAGLRADAYTLTSLTDAGGAKRSNLEWALAPVVSFYGSRELKLQAAYTYLSDKRSGDSARSEQVIELRLVTEIGEISKFRGLPGDRSSL